MRSLKIFLITFLTSVCLVLFSFTVLYRFSFPSLNPADANGENIPIAAPDSTDNKTILIFANGEKSGIFALLKLNAVDKKISFVTFPKDFIPPKSSRSLIESFEYAGIMQCVQDLSECFDISINHHMLIDSEILTAICRSFSPVSCNIISSPIPSNIQCFEDNSIGIDELAYIMDTQNELTEQELKFISEVCLKIIQNNLENIQNYALSDIIKNMSYLTTDIGKQEIGKLSRIISLFQRANPQFVFGVMPQNSTSENLNSFL